MSDERKGAGQQEGTWAKPVDTLTAASEPARARTSSRASGSSGPVQGFGKLWQKTYKVRLDRRRDDAGGGDRGVARGLRARSGRRATTSIRRSRASSPGEVALLSAAGPARMKFKTGVMVLYADDVSFTLMTPEGHMFAGWITFSAFEDGGATVAQAQVLMRAQDPIGELGLAFGGHGKENTFWEQTLANLARVARVPGRRGLDAGRLRRPQAPVVAREERASLGRDPLDAAHDEARQALATTRKEQARSAVPTGEGRPTALLTSLCTSQPGRVVAEGRDGTCTRLRGAGRWTCTRPGLGWIVTSPGPVVVPPWAVDVVSVVKVDAARRRGVGRGGGGRGARARWRPARRLRVPWRRPERPSSSACSPRSPCRSPSS